MIEVEGGREGKETVHKEKREEFIAVVPQI